MNLAEMFVDIVKNHCEFDNWIDFKLAWFTMIKSCGTIEQMSGTTDSYKAQFNDGSVIEFEYNSELCYIYFNRVQ